MVIKKDKENEKGEFIIIVKRRKKAYHVSTRCV